MSGSTQNSISHLTPGSYLKRRLHSFTTRKTRGEIVFDVIIIISMILISFLMIYPFIYMISVSVSDYKLVSDVVFLPKGFTLSAYRVVFSLKNIQRGYLNSAIYTIGGVMISMCLTTLAAYPLSKKWLPGRAFFAALTIITMYFGGGLIPVYLLVNSLGMIDSVWAILIPGAMNTYYMIVMRTYFTNSIPGEIEESCQIDGATQLQTLFYIFLPLSKPILATLTLFYGVIAWNSWFSASIYLNTESLYPIQLILRNAMATNGSAFLGGSAAQIAEIGRDTRINYMSLNYALTIAVIAPIMVIYPFCQKYFVKGVMVGSLKG